MKFICLVPPFPRCEAKGKFTSIDGPRQRKISDKALSFITIIKVRLNIRRLCFGHVSQQSGVLTIIGEVEYVLIMAQFHTSLRRLFFALGIHSLFVNFNLATGVSAVRPSDSVVC